jgi:hypothetical protein
LAWADYYQFKKLSIDHTSYGVSQFTYGLLGYEGRDSRFINPNRVTQVVASFVYTRTAEGHEPDTEVYLGCTIEVLTPHAAIGGDRFVGTSDEPRYVESIWVPLEKVKIRYKNKTRRVRIADGLGGRTSFGHGKYGFMAHPDLFSLPSDDVVPGQRQAAIDCVQAELGSLGLSLYIFQEFGIK